MIQVIYGPPGCGKTTLANRMAGSQDVVFDLDAIAQSMGIPDARPPVEFCKLKMLLAMREGFIDALKQFPPAKYNVFVIVSDKESATTIARSLGAQLATVTR